MGRPKLTPAQVRDIRAAYARENHPSMSTLARTYGVTVGTVSLIIHNKLWRNMDEWRADLAPATMNPVYRTDYILARRRKGASVKTIASELGISESAVYARIAKAGA